MPQNILMKLFARIQQRDPGQPVFHQAVQEVFASLEGFLAENPRYTEQSLLERMSSRSASSFPRTVGG